MWLWINFKEDCEDENACVEEKLKKNKISDWLKYEKSYFEEI